MTGFDKKRVHLKNDGKPATRLHLEVDSLGDGTFDRYASFTVGSGRYAHHEFPAGFSAHWVRLVADKACVATAQFHYT